MTPSTRHVTFSVARRLVTRLATLAAWLAPMGFTGFLIVALGRYWGVHDAGINASANDLFLFFGLAPVMLVVFTLVDVGAHGAARRLWSLRGTRQHVVALGSMSVIGVLAFMIER